MAVNIIVIVILAVVIFYAGKVAIKDAKSGKCSGCGGSCSSKKDDCCQIKIE